MSARAGESPGPTARPERLPVPTPLEWAYLAAGIALVLHYRWLLDDAFVYFRYVDNLLFVGAGLVYNAGEYVEGYSSPLFCLLLAALRALRLSWVSIVSLVGVASFTGFWYGAVALNRRLSPPGARIWNFPLAYLCLLYGLTSFFTSGLETPLAHAMAAVVALFLVAPRSRGLAAGVAVAPLVRPELALAVAGCAAFAWWRTRRFPVFLVAAAVAANGAWLAFRVVYYADVLPNTFYLKDDVQIAQGLAYVEDTARTYGLLPVLLGAAAIGLWLGLGARRSRRPDAFPPALAERAAMGAIALLVGAYVVKVGGAAVHYWYLSFAFPLAVLATAGLLECAAARLELDANRRPVLSTACLVGVALFAFSRYPDQLSSHPFGFEERHATVGVVSDPSFHRHNLSLQFASWRKELRIDDIERLGRRVAREGYDGIESSTWCRTHYVRLDRRVVHGFGLTDGVLARVAAPELKPGHAPLRVRLGRDLARIQREADGIGRGMYRRAVERGRAPAWVASNLDALEAIERKIYNTHDPLENLRLSASFPGPIRVDPRLAAGVGEGDEDAPSPGVGEGDEDAPSPAGGEGADASAPEPEATDPSGLPGHWGRLRAPVDVPEEQRARIEQLQAIGYLAGSQEGSGRGVGVYVREKVEPRLNLYTSGHAPTAILMDLEGRELHRWELDFAEAFPESGWIGHPNTLWWRRAYLYPNGDLLAIYEGFALVKVDRNSRLLWAFGGGAHHDLYVVPDPEMRGDIYVLTRTAHLLPRVNPQEPVAEDFVSVLTADGVERRRVSLLEAFERSPFRDVAARRRRGDLFHTNTLELLDGRLAAEIPAFRAGNVLTSMNTIGRIAVVDLERQQVVFSQAGGVRGQHDPKILPNGHLLYFDNQSVEETSRVIELDLVGRRLAWAYQGSEERPFFSRRLGAAHRLPNGNTLITESNAGRAFEVAPDGEIVWEFHNPYRAGESGEYIATLFEMVPIPDDFPTDWLEAPR